MTAVASSIDGRADAASTSATSIAKDADEPHLILVDGLSFVFRAYYGWNARGSGEGLTNSAGEDTSVLYSYAHTICSLLELKPTHMAVCMDAKGKTFRHEMFVEYKANRPPTPEPLLELIPKVEQLVRDMGVPLLRLSGVEADDIIGTVSRRASDAGFRVSICSPDKDFYQLLGPKTKMLKPSKSSKGDPFDPFTVDDFRAMHNNVIEPEQFIDFLALVGDSADNIPGVEGVGPKTALALLEQYGDIESALANAANVKGKRARESLLSEKGAASAALSRRLVEIRQNLTVPSLNEPLLPLDSLRVRPPADGGAAATRAFERYELDTAFERWRRLALS
jgi:5'-3' exonuclease